MARPVYSVPFIQYSSSTPNLSFEVPAGYTAVVRQISAVQPAGAFALYVYIQDALDAPGIGIWAGESAGFWNYLAAEGRWVVPPGGFITIINEELLSDFNAYVGGYLLTGVFPG